MRKLITLIGVAALALAALYVPYADSQVTYSGTLKDSLYTNVSADDTDVALLVRYVGATPTATDTVTVEADGDLTFKQNGVADTTLECPVSGALGGIIDVSDVACDSFGEVVDIINASADWEAVLLDVMRSDLTDDVLLAAAAADATGKDGLSLYLDTTQTPFIHSKALVPGRTFKWFMPAESINGKTINNPYLGTYSILGSVTFKTTYGAGTSAFYVYAVVPTRSGETVTQLWTEASAATNTLKTIGASTWPFGLIGKKDAKIIYRVVNTDAMSVTVSSA